MLNQFMENKKGSCLHTFRNTTMEEIPVRSNKKGAIKETIQPYREEINEHMINEKTGRNKTSQTHVWKKVEYDDNSLLTLYLLIHQPDPE
jgi:hypothetical protein